MTYFEHHYISNSDLKRLQQLMAPKYQEPENLKEIFSFGTLFHALVLEPHKADYNHPDYQLAKRMTEQFFAEKICRDIFLNVPDLKREHEFYRQNKFGLPARCKVDFGSRRLDLCGELKGLAVANEKQVDEAIDRFDYDQAICWYLNVSERRNYLFVCPSKLVKRTFKRFITRDHPAYKRGEEKVIKAVKLFRETLSV